MNFDKEQGGILNAHLLIFLGIVIVALLATGYFFYGLQPIEETSERPVFFEIEKGDSFRNISARLSREGLIRSISIFKFYAFLSGNAQKLKPGKYELDYSMSVPGIIELLATGGKTEKRILLPEGTTVKDMDFLLSREEIIESGSLSGYDIDSLLEEYPFLAQAQTNSLEGFLFPDTYIFNVESSVDEVVRRLLDTFKSKAWPEIKERTDWYDVLILSSYLEREVREPEDRQVVAGLLLKRLNAGMLLQVDATLSYANCEGRYLGCEKIKITRNDLNMASPYNTYERLGWTPTPISNPGLDTIKASLNSVETEYWYYLSAKETGETIFSKTLDEHNLNREIHL